MPFTALDVTNFRSYERATFALHPQVTLVVGPNASGKTNLLEAMYVLATTKSFRAKDRDLIRHGQDFFRIVGSTPEQEFALGYSVEGGTQAKRVTVDGTHSTIVAHIGTIQIVLFEPTDLDLVSGPPEGRRRYLDFLLCQTDREYLRTLQSYRRVLKQRNALLEGFKVASGTGSPRDELFAWDLKLASLATDVVSRRTALVEALNAALPHLYADIAGSPVPFHLEYLSAIGVKNFAEDFLAALSRNLPRDLGAGFTTIGPHRDDFAVHFKNAPITTVASRGETRTAVLACKLAELHYAEAATGLKPILLLDDVFSELDRDRRTYLLGRLEGYQTIITTTDADAITREFTTPHAIISTAPVAHV